MEENEKESILVKEFREYVNGARQLIEEKLKIAREALNQAEEISEKFGVPFYSDISFISQDYYPQTYTSILSKKGELVQENNEEEYDDILSELGIYFSDYTNTGWQHSAVC
jgi:hypothetical protein